ncbi:MAG: hypothetical protein ACRD63_18115 [Pyrinomonadaceae bacterium]
MLLKLWLANCTYDAIKYQIFQRGILRRRGDGKPGATQMAARAPVSINASGVERELAQQSDWSEERIAGNEVLEK